MVFVPAALELLKGQSRCRGQQPFATIYVFQQQGLESRFGPNRVKSVFAYQSDGASGAIEIIVPPIRVQEDRSAGIRPTSSAPDM